MKDRPNILFISTDQQCWNAISAHGNKWLRTPNLDRLCGQGVSFARSYCADPVCAPARTSWMTGRHSSETGVPFNWGHLHDHLPDLGQTLRRGGYLACHAGKWHVPGRDVRSSFLSLYRGQRPIGAGGGEYYDSSTSHAAMEFLMRHDGERPFFLHAAYVNPHDICEYLHSHEAKDIPDPMEQKLLREDDLPPLPSNFDCDTGETLLQRVSKRGPEALFHHRIVNATARWSPLQWRYYLWNYYRYVEKVDAEAGRLLEVLDRTRFRDNTLILFSSDHGEGCANHRTFQKSTLYEESIRVPLIASCLGDGIGLPKGVPDTQHIVSAVDIFPTVCDYARVEFEPSPAGRSLRPLLEGRNPRWRDFAYVESSYWGRAIITGRHKYITEYVPKPAEDFVPPGPETAERGGEQLFDLGADPAETSNIAGLAEAGEILHWCREALHRQERILTRPPVSDPECRELILRWSKRLSREATNAASTPAAGSPPA